MRIMDFNEAIRWLDDFQKFGMNLGLERIQMLVETVGHPEKKFQSIHVAGTNGKGSVCSYIASVLISAGYQVGLYISPHLETILERFSINNKLISEEEFAAIASQVKQGVDTLMKKGVTPTYFEITTAMMLLWFAESHVDYAVIEVGLGGRFDATNIITPLVSVITNVNRDHTQILGDTIEKIAFEKAGIIKTNVPIVTAAQETALSVIQQEAKKHHTVVHSVHPSLISPVLSNINGQSIHVHGQLREYTVETQNLGLYQIENVSVALLALEVLQTQGVFLPDDSIENGIRNMKYPGRMEIVHKHPLIILDGAHNPSAMQMLSKTIHELFSDPERQIIVVFGVMADKLVDEIISLLISFADQIIVTRPNVSRAMKPEDIQKHMLNVSKDVKVSLSENIPSGIQQALTVAEKQDIILITGSLFTVGEARTVLKEQYANI